MPRQKPLTKEERSALGALLNSLRKTHAGGRKPNPKPCPKCGAPYSGRAWRAHVPRCTGARAKTQNRWSE